MGFDLGNFFLFESLYPMEFLNQKHFGKSLFQLTNRMKEILIDHMVKLIFAVFMFC